MEREADGLAPNSLLLGIPEENGSELDEERTVDQKGIRRSSSSKVVAELKKQLWLAGPLILVNLLEYSVQTISIMFTGHVGELELSSASIANSFATVTGFSLLTGMGSALETLCGQSYGAEQYHMLGIHMQRAMFVLSIVCIPVTFIWAHTGRILLAVGQDPDISAEAGRYACFMIPSLFAYGLLQCQLSFLQTQNIVFPMMIVAGLTTLLHIPVCWVLVFKSALGYRGAALAISISYWINVLLLALYIKFSPNFKRTWTGFSIVSLLGVLNFLRHAIPSALMICLEFWSFDMMVIFAGCLPNSKLEISVISISHNTAANLFLIPFGLGGSVSTRVSNELGAGHPQATCLAVQVVLFMAFTWSILIGLIMIFVRKAWGYVYSNEEEVSRYIATMMPLLAISNFLDGIQSVLSGTARGCGWQKIGAFINLASFYFVGIPSSILFAFILHTGGKGLWLGYICALIVQVLSLLVITIRTNWEEEAKNATCRVYESIIPTDVTHEAELLTLVRTRKIDPTEMELGSQELTTIDADAIIRETNNMSTTNIPRTHN